MQRWIGLIGLVTFLGIAYSLSSNKQKINWRLVGFGFLLQVALALLILGIPALGIHGPLRFVFDGANNVVNAFLDYTKQGSQFVFGDLVKPDKLGFLFAFQVLPTIIFMSAIMSVFYQLGLMQKIVRGMAYVMHKVMHVSGAESLSVAADVFVGQTEAPLVIRPYIKGMTISELFSMMVGGMATVAGGVLAAYVSLLVARIPDIAGHLLTASVISAPTALLISKLMIPEVDTPETLKGVPENLDASPYSNVIEAAAEGAGEGLRLALNVGAMLLAFIALISCINGILSWFGGLIGFDSWGMSFVPSALQIGQESAKLNFELILGWLFAPLAWLAGIPWSEALTAGSLLGEKIVLNEFVAYLHLSQLMDQLSDRTVVILSYALCGFANFSSIAIQIGGTGGLAPTRKKDLAKLGVKAVIGGSLTTMITATLAGLLI